MTWREIIVTLNSLGVGDLESRRRRIDVAVREIRAGGQGELADRLEEALSALLEGKLSDHRRLLAQVVSRLGHLGP